MLSGGCATVTPGVDRGVLLEDSRFEEPDPSARMMPIPTDATLHVVRSGAVSLDAFEGLLLRAGVPQRHALPPRGAPLTSQQAAGLLSLLLRKPVTPDIYPSRMAACRLLREVLGGEDVSREELLRRVARFQRVAVLRPDGYLAWTLDGRTQQKVGRVEWREEAFRAGPFELGAFYVSDRWTFRAVDERLRPVLEGPPLAEVYDDADYLGRALDGAEESFVALYHAVGTLLTRPLDSLASLRHLPSGVAALIASSPEYFERFRLMTRGEQVKAVSRLSSDLLVAVGSVGASTGTLTRAFTGLEATVPVLSLSAEGALSLGRAAVPAGRMTSVLSGGPGAAIIVHQMGSARDGGGVRGGDGATGWKSGPNDLDWRGTGRGQGEALEEAFKRTGVSREEFVVTKWGRDKLGKSSPVEWRSSNGAEVNVDLGHLKNGPSGPHVGFQTPGKRGSGGAMRGHILLDDVSFNR
ncbi:MAG: polymorphic toxin type 47 domain-containing protein [Cystobacter sp.]